MSYLPKYSGAVGGVLALCTVLISHARRGNVDPTLEPGPLTVTITLDPTAPTRPVNRLLLGNNVQWVDQGDGLLQPGRTAFDARMLGHVTRLKPTVLRYPGGSNSDLYHWRDGIGPADRRGQDQHFHTKQRQPVLLGTREFLTLCKVLDAEPLITVNVSTSTATEAAEWVSAVNRQPLTGADGTPLPHVRYWEIGNEPYLREEVRRDLAVEPEEFARRADAFIRAMRQADSSVVLGLPLRNDELGGVTAVHFPYFAERVLATVTEPYDFVALHDAYLPFLWDRRAYRDDDLFRAAMAGYRVVDEDLAQVRNLLRKFHPDRSIKLAVTEYNALYSLGGQYDGYVATLGGALYVADVLRLLAQTDDVIMANFWSLTGNWYFGAISSNGEPRPAYHVLTAYGHVLQGRVIPSHVDTPTFANPRVGAVPAYEDTPLVAALATTEGDWLRLIVINKDPSRPAEIMLRGIERPIADISFKELGEGTIYGASTRPERIRSLKDLLSKKRSSGGNWTWADRPVASRTFPLALNVGAHALAWIEIRLASN